MKIGVGILGVALVATLGDYTWYTLNVRHGIMTGVIHGAVLLTAVGAVLGLDAGRPVKGLPIGALSGVGGALIYYLLVALVDGRTYGAAIPASWVAMWLLVALLDGRWLRAPQRRPWGEIAVRGVLAAVPERARLLPGDEHALGPAARDRQELSRPVRRMGGRLGAGSAGADAGSIISRGPSRLTVAAQRAVSLTEADVPGFSMTTPARRTPLHPRPSATGRTRLRSA